MYKALIEVLGSLPEETVSYLNYKNFKLYFVIISYLHLTIFIFYRRCIVDMSTQLIT